MDSRNCSLLGTAALSGGTASLALSTLAVGTHPLTAIYLASATYQASSASTSLTIAKRDSTTSLSANPTNGALGQTAALPATVSGSSPTGQVRFSEGATVLGTANLSSGVAHFTTAALPAGTHTFTSEYLGDGNHNGSSSSGATVTVSQGGAGAIVYSSNANSLVGQSVTFTGAVNGLSTFPATGTVTFLDGAVRLGTGTLANGSATFTTSALSAGSHAITAAYSGDNSHPPITSPPLTQQVAAQASSGALTVPPSPLMGGRKVLLSAAGARSSPPRTGQFLDKGGC